MATFIDNGGDSRFPTWQSLISYGKANPDVLDAGHIKYLQAEAEAENVLKIATSFLPAELQSPSWSRAILNSAVEKSPNRDRIIAERLAVRMAREALRAGRPPHFTAFLAEKLLSLQSYGDQRLLLGTLGLIKRKIDSGATVRVIPESADHKLPNAVFTQFLRMSPNPKVQFVEHGNDPVRLAVQADFESAHLTAVNMALTKHESRALIQEKIFEAGDNI